MRRPSIALCANVIRMGHMYGSVLSAQTYRLCIRRSLSFHCVNALIIYTTEREVNPLN